MDIGDSTKFYVAYIDSGVLDWSSDTYKSTTLHIFSCSRRYNSVRTSMLHCDVTRHVVGRI